MPLLINRIGFIQGRLSPVINGKIQAFPVNHWKDEFLIAEKIGLKKMEWTLDQEGLYQNPLMTAPGRKLISSLCQQHNITIPSLTGDCFMQTPFYKHSGQKRISLIKDLFAIVEACSQLNISYIVFPLVDNGSLENDKQTDVLLTELQNIEKSLLRHRVSVIFESDFPPQKLASFIDQLPAKAFGINYDIGNSASLGFAPKEELTLYGNRIKNIHVKDRLLHGTTVPLGKGAANFQLVFSLLREINYTGNYILQTARAIDGQHGKILLKYANQVNEWI